MKTSTAFGAVMALLANFAAAAPASPRYTQNQMDLWALARRQAAGAAAGGITDLDVLQFALTLEWLEATFYQQGFAKFPASEFQALGLSQKQIDDLVGVGRSEETHVTLLQSALAQANIRPVAPCEYNFDAAFASATAMAATAQVLEQVGVSAYLGAGPVLVDKGILSTAASILTIEARHATLLRQLNGLAAVPAAFDAGLGVRSVFSLAAPFIRSCPEGSNLALTAFPGLTIAEPAAGVPLTAGTVIKLTSDQAAGATHVAFTNGGSPGGAVFAPFDTAAGTVVMPQGLSGAVYLHLTNKGPLDGKLTDEMILAGPAVAFPS